MLKLNENLILIFLVILFLWWLLGFKMEMFDKTTTEFVPVGEERYGLRGDLLRSSNIDKYYIRPDRKIRLNNSHNWMYASNYTPAQENIKGCKVEKCPTNTNEYDNLDTCYQCASAYQTPMKIPDIYPH